ncbi:MAG TPA: LamG domain-containing protein [Xanthomonadales bacterium]|nr:LamG domain-containing protein [Xanthomonadales bacterium]
MRNSTRLLGLACVLLAGVLPAQAATLVADYRFESAANLGLDSSTFGNDAVASGGVTQVAGRNATTQAAFFDGTTGVITRAAGLAGYDGRPGFSFVAWVQLDAATDGFDGVVSQDAGGCCTHRLLLDPAHQPYINVGAHDDRFFAAPQPVGAWFHIALVGEDVGANRTGRVYVNGVEVAGSPQNFTGNLLDSSALRTYLGTGEAGNVHLIRGALDDVQIYDGALTAEQVRALFENGSLTLGRSVPATDTLALALLAVLVLAAAWLALRR